jgi:hypothetical protein
VLARQFWLKIGLPIPPGFPVHELHKISRPNNLPQQELGMFIALSCWQLWKTRNVLLLKAETTTI